MSSPKRIQMSRQCPWRADKPDAVIVARPSKWGNPFTCPTDPQRAVDAYRAWLMTRGTFSIELGDGLGMSHIPARDEPHDLRNRIAAGALTGRDLACWCPLEDAQGNSQPCHADVLLEVANGVSPATQGRSAEAS